VQPTDGTVDLSDIYSWMSCQTNRNLQLGGQLFSELSQEKQNPFEPQVDSARAEAWKLEDEVKV
jgi:hypothetical protein